MNVKDLLASIETERLVLDPLSVNDSKLIFELTNTEGWLQFIGDRNIHSETDATAYIQKILESSNICYWTVCLKEDRTSVGIITLIKRSYLSYPDIGFAFLPAFFKRGYAYEATEAVLRLIISRRVYPCIDAVTVPGNDRSIRLLKKLGFQLKEEIEMDQEKLQVYRVSEERLLF